MTPSANEGTRWRRLWRAWCSHSRLRSGSARYEWERAHAAQIRVAQVRHTYQQLPGIVVAMSLGTMLFAFMMWRQFPGAQLAAWVSLMVSTGVMIPIVLHVLYRRRRPTDAQLEVWAQWFVVLALICAAAWGSAGVLFFVVDALEYQLLLLVCMLTAAAAGMATIIGYKPGFYAAVLPIVLPVAIRMAAEGDSLHLGLAGIALLYLGLLSYFYTNVHRSLVESLVLQFQNMDLLREKSRFFAAASHDLRQPLHAQGLFVAELRERVLDPENRRILGYLDASVNAMSSLLNAMLDISRLDAGVVQPAWETFPVNEVVKGVETEFIPQMREKRLRFRVVPSSVVIRSDPALLGRILRNLVANALRYTPSGTVFVGCRRRGARLRIEVRDSGIGISPDAVASIFREFFQLGNPERNQANGLGLGLAIVERLAKLLKHGIDVKSRPGRGSVFAVDVPLAHPISRNEKPSEPDCASDLAGKRVWVVEDDVNVRRAMQGLLHRWECKTIIAASVDEVLARRSDTLPPDVIVADYRLSDNETGSRAIQRLRETCGLAVPGLIVTGDTAPARLREALVSGYRLLHKPVQPQQLRMALLQAIESQHAMSNDG